MRMILRTLMLMLLVGACGPGADAHAQFGGLKKRLPGVPGAQEPPKPARTPEREPYCANITDEAIDKYLEAQKAQKAVLERELAEANARKAAVDAAVTKRGLSGLDAMMKLGECKEPLIEKDPRTNEKDRLTALADAAEAKGDTAGYERYSHEAAVLGDLIDIAANKACGNSAVDECQAALVAKDPKTPQREKALRLAAEANARGDKARGEQYAAEARQLWGQVKAMAMMQCMATTGMAAYGPTAEEQAASDGAAEALRNASTNAA
jgi:hypothetical protein